MINLASFRIIGRIGSINQREKVTHISIASDRNVKDVEGNWSNETVWNSVTVFSDAMRKRLKNAKASKTGNLILVEGSIQSSSFEKESQTVYRTDLVANDLEILSFAKES
ncbi:single-stranded DNA-binding protein [Roseibium sp. SCP14]|uniref:single-stranded DNA-binding protein n=1 Tax=Roseibium sp. SCP14 TaxID=3141375 RepID=UPI00333566F3